MSSDASKKAEETQLKNIGNKKLDDWVTILNNCGFSKTGEQPIFPNNQLGFNYGNVKMPVHYANKNHGGFENRDELVAVQYATKGEQRRIYGQINSEGTLDRLR